MILSFLSIPVLWLIPILIQLPAYLISYPLRWLLATIISDVFVYLTHRFVFHGPWYKHHKIHHQYIVPTPLTAFVVHPYEFLLSNWLGLMIPLLVISHQELLLLEMLFVCVDVLMSHRGDDQHPSAVYHGLHHKLQNCNYGFFYLTDMFFGTIN